MSLNAKQKIQFVTICSVGLALFGCTAAGPAQHPNHVVLPWDLPMEQLLKVVKPLSGKAEQGDYSAFKDICLIHIHQDTENAEYTNMILISIREDIGKRQFCEWTNRLPKWVKMRIELR